MDRADRRITQHANTADVKWPGALKTAAEVAPEVRLTEERVRELADTGFMPHWRVDGGPPLFRAAEVKSWCARNIAQRCEGRPLPVQFNITVTPEPANDAPVSIRDIPELREIPYAYGPGVYFLVQGREVVYVGQSMVPVARIAQHNANGKDFDRVFMVPVPPSRLNAVEGALIRYLKPRLNGGKFNDGSRIPGTPGNPEDDATVLQEFFIPSPCEPAS